jgi:hypothetical protein
VPLLVREVLAVTEGDTPAVSEAVRVAEGEVLVLTVLLEVIEAVSEPEPVGVPVAVGVGVAAAVTLEDQELLPEEEALAPGGSDGATEELVEEVALAVPLEVGVGVSVLLPVELPVPVPEGE